MAYNQIPMEYKYCEDEKEKKVKNDIKTSKYFNALDLNVGNDILPAVQGKASVRMCFSHQSKTIHTAQKWQSLVITLSDMILIICSISDNAYH